MFLCRLTVCLLGVYVLCVAISFLSNAQRWIFPIGDNKGLSYLLLNQVKEVGLSVEDCSCLAQDASRIFGVYWSIGGANNGSLPPYWPARLSALSSSQNPLRLKFNGVPAQVYLSVSSGLLYKLLSRGMLWVPHVLSRYNIILIIWPAMWYLLIS